LNIVPNQVEIEARFVEVQQNDLEALGFEWLLDDNWEMAVRDGPGSPMGRQRVVMEANRDRGGFTRGMRYFDGSSAGSRSNAGSGALYGAGGILGISSILTNPEVSMVLHAIEQKGGVDLLSAPRVTTRSGVNAQIMVVREIQYPTDFDASTTTLAGGLGLDAVTVVVTPTGFETRETGVILNVTPTVGPDGYTIDLAMVPEVSELVDWIQYGVTLPDGSGYNMPKPVFSSRNVTTSIVIWDGQTVVMGGLIREEVSNIDDKIPLLGDIPIIGRLFRSKGTYSAKQNLLIFVTARLVDPAGNPINRPGMERLERGGRTSRR
jgi:general secretion pathway protein D